MVRHSDTNVIHDCEEINVIYTKAELTTSADVKTIDAISVDVQSPKAGTVIEGDVTKPLLSVPDDANYSISRTMYINNYPSVDENYDNGDISGTTMEDGKDYYFEVCLTPNEGYSFAEIDDVTLKVNGGDEFELGSCSESQITFFSKVKAAADPVTPPVDTSVPDEFVAPDSSIPDTSSDPLYSSAPDISAPDTSSKPDSSTSGSSKGKDSSGSSKSSTTTTTTGGGTAASSTANPNTGTAAAVTGFAVFMAAAMIVARKRK